MTLRVRIFACECVETLDFAAPFEVFTTASRAERTARQMDYAWISSSNSPSA